MALMFLNGDGMRGGRAHYTIEGVPLIGERRTAPLYRFFSVRDEFPALYPAAEGGQPILGELYDVPMGPLSALLATEPPELELAIIELEDGELSFAMVLRDGRARSRHPQGHHQLRRLAGIPRRLAQRGSGQAADSALTPRTHTPATSAGVPRAKIRASASAVSRA